MTDDFDDPDAEVHISITPREEDLARLGIDPEAFEASLSKALDEYLEQVDSLDEDDEALPDETPSIDDMPITIGERSFRLSELADVEISEPTAFDESE